jgi:hypothetical protein
MSMLAACAAAAERREIAEKSAKDFAEFMARFSRPGLAANLSLPRVFKLRGVAFAPPHLMSQRAGFVPVI